MVISLMKALILLYAGGTGALLLGLLLMYFMSAVDVIEKKIADSKKKMSALEFENALKEIQKCAILRRKRRYRMLRARYRLPLSAKLHATQWIFQQQKEIELEMMFQKVKGQHYRKAHQPSWVLSQTSEFATFSMN